MVCLNWLTWLSEIIKKISKRIFSRTWKVSTCREQQCYFEVKQIISRHARLIKSTSMSNIFLFQATVGRLKAYKFFHLKFSSSKEHIEFQSKCYFWKQTKKSNKYTSLKPSHWKKFVRGFSSFAEFFSNELFNFVKGSLIFRFVVVYSLIVNVISKLFYCGGGKRTKNNRLRGEKWKP